MNEKHLIDFFRLLLQLYPQDHRDTYTEEMTTVFRQALADAGDRGKVAVFSLILRELISLPSQLVQAYVQSWRDWRPVLVRVPGSLWAVGWSVGTGVAIPLAWLLMIPIAGLLLLLLRLTGAGADINPNVLSAFGFFLAIMLSMATIQWYLLRNYFSGAGWWFVATALGWAAAGGVFALLTIFINRLNPELADWLPRGILLPLGLLLGIPQMLILRRVTPRAVWWIPINLMAFSSILLAGRTFESLLESATLALPGIITGIGMWWLLRLELHDSRTTEVVNHTGERAWLRRPGILALLVVSLLSLCALSPLVYTIVQLELARSAGVYATVEEAVLATNSEGWGGANIIDISNVYAVPNRQDGMEHVWFGGATITLDRVPVGGRRDSYVTGSYYIRLQDGWVLVPEGAFPTLIGRLMELYNVEMVGEP